MHVDIENFGAQPILDIKVHRATYGLNPRAVAVISDRKINIVKAGAERSLGKAVLFVTPDGVIVPRPIETATQMGTFASWPTAASQEIEIWVEFQDSFGNRWEKSNYHRLRSLPRLIR